MRKYGRLLLVSVMAGSLIAAPVYAAPGTESLEAEKAAAESEEGALQQELTELLDKMGKLEEDLIAKGEEIAQVEKDLEDARKLEEEQYGAMKLRIKYMYEEGTTTALETLVSAENFSDLLNKAEYVAEVHLYDRSKLQEYVDIKKNVEDLKERLVEEQAGMQNMQTGYEAEEQALMTTLEEKRLKEKPRDRRLRQAGRVRPEHPVILEAPAVPVHLVRAAQADKPAEAVQEALETMEAVPEVPGQEAFLPEILQRHRRS